MITDIEIKESSLILGCVYMIKSLSHPDKFYIGSSHFINKRRTSHFRHLLINKHSNKNLQEHYNKYGRADLVFEVIEIWKKAGKLSDREQYYLDELLPPFNISRKAAHTKLGIKTSEETKLKMSISRKGLLKGIKFTDEHKRNLSIAKKGIQSSLGRVLSQETKNKISQSLINLNNKGIKQTPEFVAKRLAKMIRKVINIHTGEIYNSITEAAEIYNLNRCTLCGWLIDTRRNKTPLRYYGLKQTK